MKTLQLKTFLLGLLVVSAFLPAQNNLLAQAGNAEKQQPETSRFYLVKDINPGAAGSGAGFYYKSVCEAKKGILFTAYTPASGFGAFKSDGTEKGTMLLHQFGPGNSNMIPRNYLFKDNVNYFIAGSAIYKTNGKPGGLEQVSANVTGDIINFNVDERGHPFIVVHASSGNYELWYNDGKSNNNTLLHGMLREDSYVVMIGNTAFFTAGSAAYGFELWKSDGSEGKTRMIKDLNVGIYESHPYSLFEYNNELYFAAFDDGFYTFVFYKTDGTETGTVRLATVQPAYFDPNKSPSAQVFCVFKNELYFAAFDDTYGARIFKTNGTAAGTRLVKDLNYYEGVAPNSLTATGNRLFFVSNSNTELWTTDGSTAETKFVKQVEAASNLVGVGSHLYFINGSENENALWSSDGTAANTLPVNDVVVKALVACSGLTVADDKLFFGGSSALYGTELYAADLTAKNHEKKTPRGPAMSAKITWHFDATLYPNPARDNATIQVAGNVDNITVTVNDIAGKSVWRQKVHHQNTIQIPINKFAAGTYFVTVTNNNETKTLKLVKQ